MDVELLDVAYQSIFYLIGIDLGSWSQACHGVGNMLTIRKPKIEEKLCLWESSSMSQTMIAPTCPSALCPSVHVRMI